MHACCVLHFFVSFCVSCCCSLCLWMKQWHTFLMSMKMVCSTVLTRLSRVKKKNENKLHKTRNNEIDNKTILFLIFFVVLQQTVKWSSMSFCPSLVIEIEQPKIQQTGIDSSVIVRQRGAKHKKQQEFEKLFDRQQRIMCCTCVFFHYYL